MKLKIIFVVLSLLIMQMAGNFSSVTYAQALTSKTPEVNRVIINGKNLRSLNTKNNVKTKNAFVVSNISTPLSPIILINDITDPSMPTSISGHLDPTGSILTNFALYIEDINTGGLWDGSTWNITSYTEYPITLNSDGSFSYDLSSVGFVQGGQYLINVYGYDTSNNYIVNSEFFTYGKTALISINNINNYNQITGTSFSGSVLAQLYDTNTYQCWDGSVWNSNSVCDLPVVYNSTTQQWALDISQIPFVPRTEYELYAYDPNVGTYTAKFFYYFPSVLTTVAISPATATTTVASTTQFTATGLDQNGVALNNQPTFTWTSSDPTIGSIDSTGLFSGVAVGTTTIIASSGSISGSSSVAVIANAPICTTGADTNGDGIVSLTELLNYIGSWKIGNVSLSLLLSAIGFWKVGTGC